MRVRDRILELRRVPAGELRHNPKNWRTHPKRQRAALRGVLKEIGYAGALIARETADGLELIDGHLRAETTPDQEVPVLVLDVSKEEADKLLVTLDPMAAMAGQDDDLLRELLEGVGTDDAGLQALLDELLPPPELVEGLTDPDEIPELPTEPKTKRGDLYLLGEHRLLCGDAADAGEVDRLLEGAPIHLVHTDPPYNVRVEPRSNNAIAAARKGRTHHQGFDLERHPKKAKPTGTLRPRDRALENDFVTDEVFDDLLRRWFGNLARVLDAGRAFYIWGGYSNVANYPPAVAAAGLYLSQIIVWVKEHPVMTRKDFMGNHESAFYGWKKGAAHFFNPQIHNAQDVWTIKKVSPQKMVHLTEKPVELAGRAIEYSSRPGENVLDLFGGSGSTLIAAEQAGRKAFLMEIDAAYCDVIVGRWERFTGRSAEKTSTRERSKGSG